MNAKAERPDWLPIVEQCERQRSIDGLPSLEALYGRGNWSLMVNPPRADGMIRHSLYWATVGRNRRYFPVGSFMSDTPRPPRRVTNAQTGLLTVGFDAFGRRLVKVRVDAQHDEYNIVAVEWEVVRGVSLPYPVPVRMEVPGQ
jgi:hypothetical protein